MATRFSRRVYLALWLSVACLIALGVMLFSGIIPSPLSPAPKPAGSKWTRALSFAELAKTPPFLAVVESKVVGERGALTDNSTELPAHGAAPTPYVLIHLVKSNGKRLVIYQENPTTNEVGFVSRLSIGEKYYFPAILNKLD
jgi:hypothetical protein